MAGAVGRLEGWQVDGRGTGIRALDHEQGWISWERSSVSRLDLKYPPSPDGGIRETRADGGRRPELKNPPSPDGGIRETRAVGGSRLELEYRPSPGRGFGETEAGREGGAMLVRRRS